MPETFRSLLEAAPDAILVIERSGHIVVANARSSAIFGWQPGELVGQLIEVLVPDYIRPRHAALRDGYFDSPHTRPMGIGLDLVAARRDGSTIPVEISLSPFEFEERQCAIAIVRDVTETRRLDRELKHFNQELKRSNEELEQFAYVASHDLQEPLRMVTGYTQLLKRRYADKLDHEANEFIDYAVDGVKRMQALINDLLAYSRLSSRGKAFELVDVNEVFRQVCATLRLAIEESRARVTSTPLPTLMGDRSQLTQLLQNLLSNSLKFRRDGAEPAIAVSSTREGELWRFSVADNGIGIDAAYAEKIFVIFQRLHTRERYPGTGIGLALCKKIVERHGGEIWFESVLGEGTTFFFTLSAKE